MVIKIHNINFFIMKHIIRYTVFFVFIFCTAVAAIAQSHNYTGFKEVDKVLTDEDIEKLKEADENNDIANEYLNHATSKQNELLKKKLRVSEKRDQLQKVNSELRGKSKIGRAFAFRKKRKAKKIQKSIAEIRKEENIDELEKEVNELLEKAQNQFANHLKFNVYEKYIQEALKTADMSDPDVKKAKAKIEKAKGQFREAETIRIQVGGYNIKMGNLKEAHNLEQIALANQKEGLSLLLKQKEKARDHKAANNVVYKVQILALIESPVSDEKLREIYNLNQEIQREEAEGWYKYSIGHFNTYQEADAFKQTINVPDAFIIAYNNGRRISVEEAKKLTDE